MSLITSIEKIAFIKRGVGQIKKLLCSLPVIFILCGFFGCTSDKNEGILKIKLECAQLCKQMANPPFEEKLITVPDEIESFTEAMNKAEKIAGILDYGVIFNVYVTFKNGTEKQYVLNIDNQSRSKGLLVDQAHSEQGYSIPEQQTNVLRAIIYKN